MSLSLKLNEDDHIFGPNTAKIELIEYGDFECPYCGESYPIVKELEKILGQDLKFVFRNFPLSNVHKNALGAAIAAEVAASFGKYWEMFDLLYQNQRHLEHKFLDEYASKIGIDADKFEKEFSKSIFTNKIDADIESGLRSGVNGTPSFFINGKKYDGDPYSVDAFMEYIDIIL